MSDKLFDCLIGLMRLFSLATKKDHFCPNCLVFVFPSHRPKISVTQFTTPGTLLVSWAKHLCWWIVIP